MAARAQATTDLIFARVLAASAPRMDESPDVDVADDPDIETGPAEEYEDRPTCADSYDCRQSDWTYCNGCKTCVCRLHDELEEITGDSGTSRILCEECREKLLSDSEEGQRLGGLSQ